MPILASIGSGSAGGYGQRKGIAREPYTADFLVIAGGGSGGYKSNEGRQGGGGAGGYRNSYSTEPSGGGGSSETSLELTEGTTYTITVGGGGNGSIESGS